MAGDDRDDRRRICHDSLDLVKFRLPFFRIGFAGLLGSFLEAGAIDEFHVFIAPKVLGGAGPSPAAGSGVERMNGALRVVEFTSEPSGEDV